MILLSWKIFNGSTAVFGVAPASAFSLFCRGTAQRLDDRGAGALTMTDAVEENCRSPSNVALSRSAHHVGGNAPMKAGRPADRRTAGNDDDHPTSMTEIINMPAYVAINMARRLLEHDAASRR